MKLTERMRHLNETPEYTRLAEQWKRFEETRKLPPGHAATMIRAGLSLRRMVRDVVADHAIAHAYSDAEISTRAIEHATQTILPALHSFERFIGKGMHRPSGSLETGAQQ